MFLGENMFPNVNSAIRFILKILTILVDLDLEKNYGHGSFILLWEKKQWSS